MNADRRAGIRRDAERVLVEGEREAERSLVVCFDGLLASLTEIPDPDEEEMARLLPGVDLLRALMEQAGSFGAAAPGTGSASPLAEQILALTDGAFEAAHEVLEAADPWGYYGEAPNPELSALSSRLDVGPSRRSCASWNARWRPRTVR